MAAARDFIPTTFSCVCVCVCVCVYVCACVRLASLRIMRTIYFYYFAHLPRSLTIRRKALRYVFFKSWFVNLLGSRIAALENTGWSGAGLFLGVLHVETSKISHWSVPSPPY